MKEIEGKFHRIKNGLPYAATVKMIIKEDEINSIVIDCDGDGWSSQGYLESVTKDGYKNWKEGAIIGADYALRKTERNFKVTVNEIWGMTTDTSPSAVAAATIYGIWQAIEYDPTESDEQQIEKIVFDNDYENLPDFDKK